MRGPAARPKTSLIANGAQAGNFPQAYSYSHVGLINAAFRLSGPWD